MSVYAPPLDQFLQLGSPAGQDRLWKGEPLADYAAKGVTIDHADELMRMVEDAAFDCADQPLCYAPVHAFRALAALRSLRHLPAMLRRIERMDRLGDDGWLEDCPGVLAEFGPEAVAPIAAAWRDQRTPFGARLYIGDALEQIAKRHPEQRSRVVAVYIETLRLARYNDPGINGHAISALIELNAVEAMDDIRSAFEIGAVDRMVCGDLEDLERDIRLTAEERTAALKARLDILDPPDSSMRANDDALAGQRASPPPIGAGR
ncbi:MAG: hypothetical protein ACK4WH_05855 [Phycisphaerales bacterium]